MTGFKFAFPMLTSDDLYKLSNTWTSQLENNKSYLTNNRLTDLLHSTAEMSANFIGAELSNFANLFSDDKNKTMNKASTFEMARYFNFNIEDADEITVSFVLFNTIVKNGVVDQWKRNLYFISLFNLRNLPFKLDYTTYLPPLLYDLIIPGVKRLPFCYVSSFGAVPQGLIRNMKINNFLSAIAGNDTNANSVISVPIPEAWTITITFKSMVARTANLMLAGGADLPITINMSANDAEKVDPTLKEYNEMIKKMEEEEKQREREKEEAKFNDIKKNPYKLDYTEHENDQFTPISEMPEENQPPKVTEAQKKVGITQAAIDVVEAEKNRLKNLPEPQKKEEAKKAAQEYKKMQYQEAWASAEPYMHMTD